MAPAPRLTLDEYFRTPETVRPEELIYGAIRVADAPTPRHQAAVRDIGFALLSHLKTHPVGRVWFAPVDVVFDRSQALVVQPDLVFVSNRQLHIVGDRIWGAPDLVVEILSPRPRIGDLEERLEWFARYGVRECWLHHQEERRLEVLAFAAGRLASRRSFAENEPLGSAVLPDFTPSLAGMLEE